MEDAFFSQLDGNAVRELLLRTELRHSSFPVCTRWRSWIRS